MTTWSQDLCRLFKADWAGCQDRFSWSPGDGGLVLCLEIPPVPQSFNAVGTKVNHGSNRNDRIQQVSGVCRLRCQLHASPSTAPPTSLEACERLNSSRSSSSPSLLAGLDSPPIPPLSGYSSLQPTCVLCQMGFVREAQVERLRSVRLVFHFDLEI